MATTFGIRDGARVEAIIDGTHLYNAVRQLTFDIDYASLRTLMFNQYDLRKIFYHSRVAYNDLGEIQSAAVAKLIDFLGFSGFTTIIGESKEWINHAGQRTVRQSVDVPIACNIIESARRVDEIIVFAGSEELLPAVRIAQENGARVTFVSTISTPVEMISRDLRFEADLFVDLANLRDDIIRKKIDQRPVFTGIDCSVGADIEHSRNARG